MKINTILLSFVWIFRTCNAKSNSDVYVDQNPYVKDSIDLKIDTAVTLDQIDQNDTIESKLIEIPILDDSILRVFPTDYSNKSWLSVIKKYYEYYTINYLINITMPRCNIAKENSS